MSNVLIIRHLPRKLSFQDKEQLLKHFGAEKVWETRSKRNYVFASFANPKKAKSSLLRLHQLEIARRRLVVEYSFDKEPLSQKSENEQTSSITKHVTEFLRVLNAWNPSVDFYQPPPVHLKYKYPDIDSNIIVNIVYALASHKPFYVQTLHLMNKMCLDVPFQHNEMALQCFKNMFRPYFLGQSQKVPEPAVQSETDESEISSDEHEKQNKPTPMSAKRLHTLPKTRKRPAAILSTVSLPKIQKVPINQEEVFETVAPLRETKKISVVVAQDALQKAQEEPKVVGELGKFEKQEQPEVVVETPAETEQPTITRKELLKNRISFRDMKILPVFKKYHPGQPSMRLYIKNLAKTVTELDVKRIYKHYIEHVTEDDVGFDVRVMQEGKMKGQAFVTFPSVEIAETALHETNGYMLKERPMVVQFARAANKKTIE
ncbi:RNA-binding region-containing protein 3-like [Plodia interpunctella]|uniref:RNA-binding region-containing protein 3-like n=1 Tax=Plodia interpunctella TaxID=58824 RepID=UPI00236759D1|nr:RNA-binding region-containing protein 3-like [Plodia interpunctella]